MTHAPLQIAIVDDVPVDRALIRRALTKGLAQPFVCHEGAKGADALALCRELQANSASPIDILLLDMRLPDINGIEVLQLLKDAQAILPLPVVMLTGSPREAEIQVALAAGAQDFIPKGQVTPDNLPRIVLNAIERFRLMQNLQASEERSRQQLTDLQTIYAATPVGLAVLDRELRYVRINEYLAEINGLPVAEHIGNKLHDILPNIAAAFATQLQQVLETGQPLLNLEMTGYTKAQPGVKRTWLGSFYPLQDADGAIHGVNCALYEVTGRKQAEEALRQSENRYRRLVEDQSDLICRFQPDFRLTFVNQPYSAILGKSPTELIGQKILDFIPVEYQKLIADHLATLTAAHPNSSYENPLLLPDGSVRWYYWTDRLITDEAGQPIEYQAVGRDVTERRRAEQAEHDQRLLAEALRDSIAALTSSLTVEQVMQQILTAAATVVPSEAGRIILFKDKQWQVAYLRGFPPDAEEFFRNSHLPAQQQSYFVADTYTEPQWQFLPFTEWIRSSLGVPIELYGEIIGLLVVDSATPQHFCTADIDKLSAFAHYAGLALEKAEYLSKLEARVVERTAELQAAKERVEAILNHSPDGILLVQPDLSVQQTNLAFETLFGHCASGACGQSLAPLLHPDDLPPAQALIQTVVQEQLSRQSEVRACRYDGTVFDAELSIGPLRDGNLVCTMRDITERKRVQNAVAEERNLLRTMIDAIPDLIYVKDRQHRFVLHNARPSNILPQVQADQLIGKTDADLLGLAVTEHFQAQEEALFRTGQPLLNHEELLTTPEGSSVWLSTTKVPLTNLNGDIIGLAGVARDITKQKEHERQLHYYASLQETVRDAVMVTDLELRIQSWNRAAETIYGWRADEVIGKMGPDILRTRYTSTTREYAHEQLMTQGYWEAEVVQRRKDGTDVPILASVTLLKDEQGKLFGMVAVNHDITEQQRAQEAIRASEQRYRLLADNISDLVARSDVNSQYLYVSPSSRALIGYEPTEMIGQSRLNFIHPDDLPIMLEAVQTAIEDHQAFLPLTVRFRHKQGHYVWLETNSRALYAEETGEIVEVITASRDVTQRQQAEEALRASEEKFRLLVAAAPVAILISDQHGQITLSNQQASEIFGYQPDEFLGEPIELLVPAAAKAAHVHHRQVYHRAPRVRQMGSGLELFAQRKDGTEFPVEIELSYVETATGLNVVCFIMDITERKRAQEALREQRDFLQLVINSVPHLITVKDSAGRFALANQSAAQIYGITPMEMVGKSDMELNPNQAQVAFFRQKDREALQSGQPLFIAEQPILGRYYQSSKIPLKNHAGQSDRLLIVSSDITERKQTEAALQQALQREKELGELKSRFVSMASHEFRTPLAAIRAIAETLQAYRHRLPDEQIDKRLGKIQDQVDYLKSIIEDVLQLTRLQARRIEFHPAPLNLAALCAEVVDELREQSTQPHRLFYTGDATLPAIELDKKLMRQIINNLVTNALKYSPENKPVHVTLASDQEAILFTVQDQGIGIPAADQVHLFEPFHRAANVGTISGTGLGLTIVKESVEIHGGTIAIESQVGVGTTIHIRIPVTTNRVAQSNA